MSLKLYRRHARTCKYDKAPNPQEFIRCTCPIYAYGYINNREIRKSLKTRDWSRAERQLTRADENPALLQPARTVNDCITSFLSDCEARELAPETIRAYNFTLGAVSTFCGASEITRFNLETLSEFRNKRRCENGDRIKPNTARKEVRHLRTFCAYCVDRTWLPVNHAKKIKPPEESGPPTMPFTRTEVSKILGACEDIWDRALVRVMLYSGFRISDTVKLQRANVDLTTGNMLIRVQKTGVKQYINLHHDAVEALKALPNRGPHFLWHPGWALNSSISEYAKRTGRILARAGVVGHPHRFRDTFSVTLLENGEDIRTVQMLLGHKSVATTEKHYAPWVSTFQARLDAATSKLSFGKVETA